MEELQRGLPGRGRRGGPRGAARGRAQHGRRRATGCARATPPGRSTARPRRSTSLREGMRQMGEDLRRRRGRPRRPAGAGRRRGDRRDRPRPARPADRRRAAASAPTRTCCPRATAPARARALLDEIRRRAGELGRPQLELDYLQPAARPVLTAGPGFQPGIRATRRFGGQALNVVSNPSRILKSGKPNSSHFPAGFQPPKITCFQAFASRPPNPVVFAVSGGRAPSPGTCRSAPRSGRASRRWSRRRR